MPRRKKVADDMAYASTSNDDYQMYQPPTNTYHGGYFGIDDEEPEEKTSLKYTSPPDNGSNDMLNYPPASANTNYDFQMFDNLEEDEDGNVNVPIEFGPDMIAMQEELDQRPDFAQANGSTYSTIVSGREFKFETLREMVSFGMMVESENENVWLERSLPTGLDPNMKMKKKKKRETTKRKQKSASVREMERKIERRIEVDEMDARLMQTELNEADMQDEAMIELAKIIQPMDTTRKADTKTVIIPAQDTPDSIVIELPEELAMNAGPMQVITLPDGSYALQMEQKQPVMAQMVTVDEDGNILSNDGTFPLSMMGMMGMQHMGMMGTPIPPMTAQPMISVGMDEFGNMYLQEDQPTTSNSSLGDFGYLEVTGDPAEIAAMYPGMQMIAVNDDGTLDPNILAHHNAMYANLPAPTAETTYVNAKQFSRIMKRRDARARLEASGRVPKLRSKYLHESRHKHAMMRSRGVGGKFGNGPPVKPKKVPATLKTPRVKKEKEYKLPTRKFTPPQRFLNTTPLNTRSPVQKPNVVITHMPLPLQSKARPPGFRAARPSEMKQLLPTTYSHPLSLPKKFEAMPDKILEESPSNSNSPPVDYFELTELKPRTDDVHPHHFDDGSLPYRGHMM